MEPAKTFDPRDWETPSAREAKPPPQAQRQYGESGREIEEWEIKLGKTIFYLTVAASVWFFYWLNGIQCPC